LSSALVATDRTAVRQAQPAWVIARGRCGLDQLRGALHLTRNTYRKVSRRFSNAAENRNNHSSGGQLAVEDGPLPDVRETIAEASQAGLEGVAAEPVTALAAAIAHLEEASWLVDDEPADTVDLRLANEAIGIGDGRSQRTGAIVSNELRNDRGQHGLEFSPLPVGHDAFVAGRWAS
jgi:hypothetical protein